MKTKLFLLSLICLLFIQCAKNDDVLLIESAVETEELSQNETALNNFGYTCPLVDYSCTSLSNTLNEMTGPYNNPSSGKLDKALNCGLSYPMYCNQPCASQVYTHLYDAAGNFIEIWTDNGNPCGANGIYTGQAQQVLVDKIKQIAVDQAPLCQNIKMKPYKYNVYGTVFLGTSDYFIAVDVSYTAHCGRTRM